MTLNDLISEYKFSDDAHESIIYIESDGKLLPAFGAVLEYIVDTENAEPKSILRLYPKPQ